MKNGKKTLLWLLVILVLSAGTVYLVATSVAPEAAQGSGTYTPGTYTAAAQGIGEVKATVTVDANGITGIELDVSNETPTIGQAAADTLKEQVIAAQSADIDGVSGATVTSTAVKTAVADCLSQASAGGYTPGTYTAAAQGIGEVKVTVTVDASSITNVELDVSNETPTIGQAAADTLKEQVIAAQSADIDGVSGATVTSTAVKTAVADCLSQASA